ncbi:hypothetical protein GKE82_01695 [Conexibacter sp. W3-3-2]|nr:hypothetical protein [Conexibacter sp. W3-3-2]
MREPADGGQQRVDHPAAGVHDVRAVPGDQPPQRPDRQRVGQRRVLHERHVVAGEVAGQARREHLQPLEPHGPVGRRQPVVVGDRDRDRVPARGQLV